jgi:hypothetical protein
MGMSRETRAFPLGSLVIVKRGHHAGSVFAVIGTEGEGPGERVLIADGRRISARKPKRKNFGHVEPAGIVAGEIAARLAGGKFIDDGWLVFVISRHAEEVPRLIA